MHLLVGLGNPGPEYAGTRHNFGFAALDSIADEANDGNITEHGSFVLFRGFFRGGEILLMKPMTYMNRSGKALQEFLVPDMEINGLMVVHDDLDIAFGRMKIKDGGGDGGHKGVRSVIRCLGTGDFIRFRLGIGRDEPVGDAEDYVLSPFDTEEKRLIEHILGRFKDAVDCVIEKGVISAMNEFNGPVPAAQDTELN